MRYLVDANVLSEPTKPDPDEEAVEWLRANEPYLSVDPVILGELRFGILLLPKGRRRSRLEAWFAKGIGNIRCLDWTAETGLRWAGFLADLRRAGQAMPVKDSLIAATALTHGLTIATRNTAGFSKPGLKVINPFASK